MRRDLLVSLLGHLTLVALIIIFNPSSGRFSGTPEIMKVNLAGMELPPTSSEPVPIVPHEDKSEEIAEIEPLEIPEAVPDEIIDDVFKLASPDTMETIVVEQPKPKPEKVVAKTEREEAKPAVSQPEADGKGGLDIAGSVSAGTGDGSGEPGGYGHFGLPYNTALLERKIARAWRNPVTSATSVYCTIYFQIGRDGYLIGEPVVEKSSGITTFDKSALYAVMRVNRFPSFPVNFEYDYIGVHLEFGYVP
ncbi:MAG: TonB C-terminal domain-containing protein [candidate division Zixibacteria bacterium]|nr:TonB C-terminal domain-containing protein [candidate division Zixibacteria bacterium]